MVLYCCVPFCKESSYKNKKTGSRTSFHEYPVDEALRKQWIDAIPRKNLDTSQVWHVCSLHFTPESFAEGKKHRRLNKGAVPSMFPDDPIYGQKNGTVVANDPAGFVADFGCRSESKKRKANSSDVDVKVPRQTIALPLEYQCQKLIVENEKLRKNVNMYKRRYFRLKKRYIKLQAIKSSVEATYAKKSHNSVLEKVREDASNGELFATFILQQLDAYRNKKIRWNEKILKCCILWRARSPSCYHFVQEMKLLKLPNPSTLKRCLGSATAEQGITSLKARLNLESETRLNVESETVLNLESDAALNLQSEQLLVPEDDANVIVQEIVTQEL